MILFTSLKYDCYNKDHYLYKGNDLSDKYKFLIKGKVSFSFDQELDELERQVVDLFC